MAKVYFITETYLKNNTPISLNIEQYLLNMAIIDAQELHIQNVLGSILYRKLKSIIKPDHTIDPSYANYKTLLIDYVNPALVQWTLYECLPYLRYKLMNKGVQSQNSDNSTSADLDELKYIQNTTMNRAEFYTQRLADYLLENYTLFPEYTAATDIDDIKPSANSYFSGMQLDETVNPCRRSMGFNDGIVRYE